MIFSKWDIGAPFERAEGEQSDILNDILIPWQEIRRERLKLIVKVVSLENL